MKELSDRDDMQPAMAPQADMEAGGPTASGKPTDESLWNYRRGGVVGGPITFEYLCHMAARGELLPVHQVKAVDGGDWVGASSLTGLFSDPATGGPLRGGELRRRLSFRPETATGVRPTEQERASNRFSSVWLRLTGGLLTVFLIAKAGYFAYDYYHQNWRLRLPAAVREYESDLTFEPGHWRVVLRAESKGFPNYVLRYWLSPDRRSVERLHAIEFTDTAVSGLSLPLKPSKSMAFAGGAFHTGSWPGEESDQSDLKIWIAFPFSNVAGPYPSVLLVTAWPLNVKDEVMSVSFLEIGKEADRNGEHIRWREDTEATFVPE